MPNGCMSTGGSGLNWFVENFAGGLSGEAEAAGISLHRRLDELAEVTPAGADGLTILPYFIGEKTPIHDPAARGVFAGLSLMHGIGHVWRAMLEAYGYALVHHMEVIRDIGHEPRTYFVSDGGSASRVWMQIVADMLQVPLQCLTGHPGSCLGIAWTAAIGAGLADDWLGVSKFIGIGERLIPNPDNAAVYAEGYRTYRDLYTRLRPRPSW